MALQTGHFTLTSADLDPEVAADIEVMISALPTDPMITWSTGRRLAGGVPGSSSPARSSAQRKQEQ